MHSAITRRMLVALAAALPASALQAPAPSAVPSAPEDERKAAEAQLRSNAEQLSKVALEMDTEPAVHFKA